MRKWYKAYNTTFPTWDNKRDGMSLVKRGDHWYLHTNVVFVAGSASYDYGDYKQFQSLKEAVKQANKLAY